MYSLKRHVCPPPHTVFLWLMLAGFLLLGGLALFWGAGQDLVHTQDFCLSLCGLALLLLLLPPLSRRIAALGHRRALLLLTGLCLLVKLSWVLYVRVPLAGDYAVFWNYADMLARRPVVYGGRYLALFPHIFGYAQFLGLFFSLFGSSLLLPCLLNVLLTVCSGWLLYALCLDWRGPRAGAAAFLLWIACPSQTMYNSLVLSEPLYTTLNLALLLLVTRFAQARPSRRAAAWAGVGGGVLLRLIQGTRPIAAVWLIALGLWVLLLRPQLPAAEPWARPLFAAALLLVYLLTGPLWDGLVTLRIGEAPASTPGYNILVGLNTGSGGRWNQADSDQLFRYSGQPGASAQQAQKACLADALARVRDNPGGLPALFRQKLTTFLGGDNACVGYSASVVRHTRLLSHLCNGFFYLLMLLALFGAVQLWRRGERSAFALVPLYCLGLTLAQLLVEVAGRYHYSLVPMLILLGQAGGSALPYPRRGGR